MTDHDHCRNCERLRSALDASLRWSYSHTSDHVARKTELTGEERQKFTPAYLRDLRLIRDAIRHDEKRKAKP